MSNKLQQRTLASLVPYVNNSRTHSQEQVEQIVASINEFGFTNPLLIDEESNIIAGHGRLMAAMQMGLYEVPCIVLEGLTDEQKRAYVIADNQLAANAGWDLDMLRVEIEALEETDFNIDLLGFDSDFLDDLLADHQEEEDETQEDDAPEPPADPRTEPGDVWLLGKHRVMCGDSTLVDSVSTLMADCKADMVFTDPPYNTGMTSQQMERGKPKRKVRLSAMFDDAYTDDEWQQFMSDFCGMYDMFTRDDVFLYVCLDWRRSHELVPHLKQHWKFSNLIVWDRVVHGLGSDYKYTHEFIHVCKKGSPPQASNRSGDREYSDVWHIQRKIGRTDEHATIKPLELCERAIRHASKRGDLVLDLFGGSGSTLIAAERTGRACYTMEMSPAYVDVIVRRWQEMTKKDAILEQTGEIFNDG